MGGSEIRWLTPTGYLLSALQAFNYLDLEDRNTVAGARKPLEHG